MNIRLLKLALATLALLVVSVSSFAGTAVVNGITWSYFISNGEACIDSGSYTSAISESTFGDISIPSTLGGCRVTSIGNRAFYGCSGLTSVSIPDSVTYIGDYAFCGCSGLSLVTIPNCVTNIGDCVFRNCSGLTSVTIPDSVTSIGSGAFNGCSGLTSVSIPDSVTSIGNYAFSGCSGLTSVTIPASVTCIGDSAFSGCNSALYDTNSVLGVMLVEGWVVQRLPSLSGDLILTGAKGVADDVFAGYGGIKSVTIPSSLKCIGEYAFSVCNGIKSVTILGDATRIGNNAFANCRGLSEVTIGSGSTNDYLAATSIGVQAFYNCSGMQSLTIGRGVAKIEEDAFANCGALTSVNISDLASWCHIAFSNLTANPLYCASHLFLNGVEVIDLEIPSDILNIGNYAFCNCTSILSVEIPVCVRTIGSRTFWNCTGLTSLPIPNSVTNIGEGAFCGCTGITTMTIPDGVISIEDNLFYGCKNLTEVTLGSRVTSIGSGSFCRCGVKSLVIPDSVTSIGAFAFQNSGLRSLTLFDSVTKIGEYAFDSCYNLAGASINIRDLSAWCTNTVFTPLGHLAYQYETTRLFLGGDEITELVIPEGVERIGDYAFSSCSGLTSATIPNSVTNIGEYAFSGCNGLTSLTIPESVLSFGWGAFSECYGLISVAIPNYLTSIDDSAFFGCSGLKSVTIPNSVIRIGNSAFSHCSGLRSVTIPGSVKYIGADAFECCSSLNSVTISEGVKEVAYEAFSGCGGLTSAIIPNSVTSLDYTAFRNCSNLKTLYLPTRLSSEYDLPSTCSVIPYDIVTLRVSSLCEAVYPSIGVHSLKTIGEVACRSSSPIAYQYKDEEPVSRYVCTGWTGSGSVPSSGNGTSVRFAIKKNSSLTWNWRSEHAIKVFVSGGSSSFGSRWIADGTTTSATIVPVPHLYSISLSGDTNGVMLADKKLLIPSDGPREIMVTVNEVKLPLDVITAQGAATPVAGHTEWSWGDEIKACVKEPDPMNGMRYVCTGWCGTGSTPVSGVGTNVTFSITDSSTLTWNWRKDNEIKISVVGSGSCPFGSQWVADGTTATATIVPATHLYSISLSGDTDGVTLSGTTLSIPSDRPREITVAVEEVKVSLDTMTAHGEALPVSGCTKWSWGDVVLACVTEPEPTNGICYVCTGWAGTGSVPASGTGTNVTFTIEEDSTLTWLWETNVWTECTVSGDASATPVAEWRRKDGEALVIPFSIENAFIGWSLDGDADEVIVDEVGKSISIPSDCPRQIEASFVSVKTAVGTGGKHVAWSGAGADWRPTFDANAPGGSCLRTLATDANASSAVSATVSGSGRLSFDWRISAGRGDTCKFYVDGVEQSGITRSTSWTTVSVNIGSGNHTLEWVYSRGSGSATGEDAAFIDNVDWRPDVTLAVASAFGNPSPTAGTHSLVYGDSVSASVTAPEAVDGTRRVCTGWSGSGSLPANGTGTTVSFVITNDSTLVWNWRTDYLTTLQVAGPVGADFAGEWLNSGTTKVVHWTPTVPYFTISLSGDIQGIILDEASRTLTIPANSPRNITLTVTELTLSSALDISSLVWTTTGAASWFPEVAVSSDSADAVQSGQVIGDDVSGLETTLVGPGTLSWSWRLDSLGNAGVDVILDGEWLPAYEPIGEWAEETLEIGEGEHIVRFEFWNAGTAATIADCAYLDQVSWTPVTSQTVVIGEVEVPTEWLSSEAAAILSANGGNYEAAANATAANGQNTVWECYVAGISPTNETAKFEARIDFVDGSPVVKWSPDLNEDGTKHERVYTVEGKANLTDSWAPTNSASRFFRVKESMP